MIISGKLPEKKRFLFYFISFSRLRQFSTLSRLRCIPNWCVLHTIMLFFFRKNYSLFSFFLKFLDKRVTHSVTAGRSQRRRPFCFLFLPFSSLNIFYIYNVHKHRTAEQRQRRRPVIMCFVVLHRDGIPNVRTRFTTAAVYISHS